MNEPEALAALTPQRVQATILALLAERPPEQRLGAPIGVLVQRLMAELGLQGGIESSPTYFAVKNAVRAAVGQIPGLRYVESSP